MTSGSNAPFLTLRRFFVEAYGAPLHRVPLDLGLGCPNRRPGGTGGCTFCAEDGGRAPQLAGAEGLREQVAAGVAFARRRYGATRFMAYVQAFSGTFAPPERQRQIYEAILQAHPFAALSVGTRPDCLSPETLAVLGDVRRRVDLWVELGVQSAHDRTLRLVRRGHDWACSRDAIQRLAALGIRAVAHVILGLPGETPADWDATADALAALPLAGVKIHNLHVIRGTALADEYGRAPFPVPKEAEYAEGLIAFLRRLPPTFAILRINTDTPADRLLAPRWRMTKGQFRDYVVAEMRRRGVRQGDGLAERGRQRGTT